MLAQSGLMYGFHLIEELNMFCINLEITLKMYGNNSYLKMKKEKKYMRDAQQYH